MADEIEVKVLDIQPEIVVERLKKLGAKKEWQGLVRIKAFDYPDGSLKKKGLLFRVRENKGKVEVTFKGKAVKGEFKVREEIEFHSDDMQKTCRVLEEIGMVAYADHEKYRCSYSLGEDKVEFDKYPGLPWFVEVESPTKEQVKKTVELLGFDFADKKKVTGLGFGDIFGNGREKTKFIDVKEADDYAHIFR